MNKPKPENPMDIKINFRFFVIFGLAKTEKVLPIVLVEAPVLKEPALSQ